MPNAECVTSFLPKLWSIITTRWQSKSVVLTVRVDISVDEIQLLQVELVKQFVQFPLAELRHPQA